MKIYLIFLHRIIRSIDGTARDGLIWSTLTQTCSGGPSLLFSFVGGFSPEKNSKMLLCIFLEEEPGSGPMATLFPDCSSLVFASPLFPD